MQQPVLDDSTPGPQTASLHLWVTRTHMTPGERRSCSGRRTKPCFLLAFTDTFVMQPLGLRDLLKPRPRFTVHTPPRLIAFALWDYGEDALAHRALRMSEEESGQIDRISAWYEMPDYPLPMTGQRIPTTTSRRSRPSPCLRGLSDLWRAPGGAQGRTAPRSSTTSVRPGDW